MILSLPGNRLNTCPFQGSRTIRTEEAVLISLSQLSRALAASARVKEINEEKLDVEFSDGSPSEESSSGDSDRDDSSSEEEGDK